MEEKISWGEAVKYLPMIRCFIVRIQRRTIVDFRKFSVQTVRGTNKSVYTTSQKQQRIFDYIDWLDEHYENNEASSRRVVSTKFIRANLRCC